MVPPASFTRYINVARALPHDSAVARAIGCLLVLRCDLILDHYGLIEEKIPVLDVIDSDYRRLFFFRANSRTLYSAQWVLNRLTGLSEFRSWLSAESEVMQEWNDKKKVVDRTAGQVAAIRNAIGAHAEQDLMDAVGRIPDDQMGLMEFSDKDGERPRMAGLIVTAALLPDAKPGTEQDALRAAFDARAYAESIAMALNCAALFALVCVPVAMGLSFALRRKTRPTP